MASPLASTIPAAADNRDGVGHEGHDAGTLDGDGHLVLMLPASTGDATGLNLAAIGHILAKKSHILVVDELDLVLAKLAILLARLTLKIVGHGGLTSFTLIRSDTGFGDS
jgi:hypothetical protein